MKRVSILFTLGILFCLTSFGQQTSFDHLFKVSLPKDIKKQAKEQIKSTRVNKSKSSLLDLENGKGDFYVGNGYILQLNAAPVNLKDDYLKELKEGRDESYALALPPKYISSIKSYKDYKVLVINYEYNNDQNGYYNFYSVSNTNKVALNGVIEYSKAEREKAAKALDELLLGLSFKK